MALIYLPDTNAWIGYLRQKDGKLLSRFRAINPSDLALCSIVSAELSYGVYRSPLAFRDHNRKLLDDLKSEFVSLPFDDRAAEEYGVLRAYLVGLGMAIGPNDLMIASVALAERLTLVTHDVREFSRVPGLLIEDWQTP